MKLSKQTVRALSILANSGEVTAKQFAKMMWPASPGWQKVYKGRKSSVRGKGMWLAGGSYLSRLASKGYAQWVFDESRHTGSYRISEQGKTALKEKPR